MSVHPAYEHVSLSLTYLIFDHLKSLIILRSSGVPAVASGQPHGLHPWVALRRLRLQAASLCSRAAMVMSLVAERATLWCIATVRLLAWECARVLLCARAHLRCDPSACSHEQLHRRGCQCLLFWFYNLFWVWIWIVVLCGFWFRLDLVLGTL